MSKRYNQKDPDGWHGRSGVTFLLDTTTYPGGEENRYSHPNNDVINPMKEELKTKGKKIIARDYEYNHIDIISWLDWIRGTYRAEKNLYSSV